MTGPITPERLAEIEARANAATEGPWEASMSSPSMHGANWTLRTTGQPGIRLVVSEYQHGPGNADFMAHARTDVPDLVAAVRERDAEIERLLGELAAMCDDDWLRRRDRCMKFPGTHNRHDRDAAGAWENAANRLRAVLEAHGYDASSADRAYLAWEQNGRDKGDAERVEESS